MHIVVRVVLQDSGVGWLWVTLNIMIIVALTQIDEQIRIIEERSNDRHIGSIMVTSPGVFINIQSQIDPIKTARIYCIAVSNGQWMEEPQPQSM